jgi:purine nucleosidase
MPDNPASINAASLAQRPSGGAVRAVIDTDAANEIDDQFAVAYALLSPERIEVEALYAAPFHNDHSTGPGDGMRQSYEELHRVLACLDPQPELPILEARAAGCPRLTSRLPARQARTWWVGRWTAPRRCMSSRSCADQCRRRDPGRAGDPGPHRGGLAGRQPQRLASGGRVQREPGPHAGRVLLDSGVRLVHVPCRSVTEQLLTTQPEIERYVRGRGAIGEYLAELYDAAFADHLGRSRSLWDLGPVAWLVNPEWVPTVALHSPLLTDQDTWSHDPFRHLILEVRSVERDAIFTDLFRRLDQVSMAAQPTTGAR